LSVVVDASVIAKWYVPEAGSEMAAAIFEREQHLIAPAHVLGEVGEVLLRRFRNQRVSREQLQLARAVLPAIVELVPVHELFDTAVEVAFDAATSFYDALYVAAAAQADALLITADRRLLSKLRGTPWSRMALGLDDWFEGEG
jgi:predicted nucleic acid-binding protein